MTTSRHFYVAALLAVCMFSLGGNAQVEIDQAIELTGTTGNRAVRNLEAPVNGTDAANKDYVDNSVSGSGGGGLAIPTMMSQQSSSAMTFVPALLYCKNLNEDGYSDWRMPTYDEITYMLTQGGITIPNITSNANVWFRDPIGYGSTSYARHAINFAGTGTAISWWDGSSTYNVRCVR